MISSRRKTLCENFDDVKAAYAATSCWSLDTCANVPIDLHPGAAAYYKEIGLIE